MAIHIEHSATLSLAMQENDIMEILLYSSEDKVRGNTIISYMWQLEQTMRTKSKYTGSERQLPLSRA